MAEDAKSDSRVVTEAILGTPESDSSADTTEAEETSTADSSAETENTVAATENTVPQSRLKEVVDERNALREKVKSFEQRAAEPAEAATDDGEGPPDHYSGMEKANWIIDRRMEQKFGMSLDNVKQLLGTSKNTAEDYAERKWIDHCKQRGIDPKNLKAQKMALGLVRGGESINDAMKEVEGHYGKKTGSTNSVPPSANVETSNVSDVMVTEGAVAKDKAQAVALAKKGKRAKHESIDEILARRKSLDATKVKGGSQARSN